MRILLSGATGFIGTHFIEILSDEYDIYCIAREKSDTSVIEKKCHVIRYKEYIELFDIVRDIKPEVLVHLAGVFVSKHDRNSIGKILECNVVFTTFLFDAACEAKCKKIINIGSYWQNYNGQVYCPVNLYSATKQSAEDILRYYCEACRCRSITLVIFDSYGTGDTRKKIFNIINSLDNGSVLKMSGGEQKLYLIHVSDIVRAIQLSIDRLCESDDDICEKFYLRDNKPVILHDIVEYYLTLIDKNIKVIYGALPYRDREIMDPNLIGEVLPGWSPKVSIQEGLLELASFARNGRINS